MEKGKTVTIVILIILLLGAGAYIYYDDVYKVNQEAKKIAQEEKNGKKDDSRQMYVSELGDINKTINDYFFFAEQFALGDVKNYSNQSLLLFAVSKIDNPTAGFDKDDVNTVIKNYFGNNVTVNQENIMCTIDQTILYNYDSGTSKYTYNESHPGHGGTGYYQGDIHVVGGSYKNKKYTLTTRILYGNYCGETCQGITAYYKSASDAKDGKNPLINLETNSNKTFNDIEDFVPITTYVFNKEDSNYVLKSISVAE